MGRSPNDDVLRPVYRVAVALRWLLLAHALALNAARADRVAHPCWLLAINLVMVAWTIAVTVVAARSRHPAGGVGRLPWLDLAVTLVVLACSGWVLGPEQLGHGQPALPVLWLVTAPMFVAVARGAAAGLWAALLVGLVRLAQTPRPDERAMTTLVFTCLAAWGFGAVIDALREATAARDRETARAAALAERDRMNRIVHDGALQVLAMVEREGPELGPRGVRLASLAREQEVTLRRQLQSADAPDVDRAGGEVDLVDLLERHADERVTVTSTSGSLGVSRETAGEVDAAVAEALTNVLRHAGPEARAWVLVEGDDGRALVSVRDDGVGVTPEEFEAGAAGRLGVRQSIRGRIESVGGTARVTCRPGRGVEWELLVPRRVEGSRP